jgi:hypothetical protein
MTKVILTTGLQQTDETLRTHLANWSQLHENNISTEEADRRIAAEKHEKRLRYIRRYLKERAARKGR